MIDKHILKQGAKFAGLAVLYVTLVATVMSNAEKIFGPEEPKGVLVPIGMLLLLVVSAATMGLLIFGKPVMMYVDGKKREALSLVLSTLGSLGAFTVLIFLLLAATRG